jgi:hypothetical protein
MWRDEIVVSRTVSLLPGTSGEVDWEEGGKRLTIQEDRFEIIKSDAPLEKEEGGRTISAAVRYRLEWLLSVLVDVDGSASLAAVLAGTDGRTAEEVVAAFLLNANPFFGGAAAARRVSSSSSRDLRCCRSLSLTCNKQ